MAVYATQLLMLCRTCKFVEIEHAFAHNRVRQLGLVLENLMRHAGMKLTDEKWQGDASQTASGLFLLKKKAKLLQSLTKGAGEGEYFTLLVRYLTTRCFCRNNPTRTPPAMNLYPVKWAKWSAGACTISVSVGWRQLDDCNEP